MKFKAGDKVQMFSSRVKLFGEEKLRSTWKGPYTIVNTSSHRAITHHHDHSKYFKVNGQHLKVFHEPFYCGKVIDEISLVDFESTHVVPGKKSQAPLHHLAHNFESPHKGDGNKTSPSCGR